MPWSASNSRPKAGITTGSPPTARIAAWTYLSPTAWFQPPRPFSLRQAETPIRGRNRVEFMRFIIALGDSLGNCRRSDPPAPCAALPCMVPARPMSTPPPAGPAGPAAQPQQAPSPLTIHGQYIKDLSFENPRAPQSLIEQKQPQLTLNVNVATRQFDPKTFEVTLTIEASAQTPEKEPLFVLELIYGGTVSLGEVPQEAFGPLLLIETPRLLF